MSSPRVHQNYNTGQDGQLPPFASARAALDLELATSIPYTRERDTAS